MSLGRKSVTHMVMAALVVAGNIALGQTQAPLSPVPVFTLVLIAPSGPFKLGEPIHLKMRMTSTTDHVMYVPVPPGPSWGDEIVGIDMINSMKWPVLKWRDLKISNEAKRPSGSSYRSDHISPQQTVEYEVRLEKVFKITAPGHYTVRIARWDWESQTSVQSEPIEIDILPAP